MGRADSDNAGGSGNTGGRGGSSGSSGGGRDGRGNNTPGHPGNPGRRGNNAPSSDGRGNNTPGHPDNPGRIGNEAPSGPSRDTPGNPNTEGRRGAHVTGTTAASRARDAMSRHRDEAMTRRQDNLNRASIANGGLTGDVDDQAGLGLDESVDRQKTENALNHAGVHDTLGMENADRLAAGVEAGAALSQGERQQARGIVAGHSNQFAANRAKDILGAIPGIRRAADAMVGMTRPSQTMEVDYNEGRQLANDVEMGALSKTAVGVALGHVGVTAPMGGLNTAQAIARDKVQNAHLGTLRDVGLGTQNPQGPNTPDGGGLMTAAHTPAQPMNAPAPASPTLGYAGGVDMDAYGQGLLSVANSL